MMEDVELLRRYAEEKAQDAFAELVRRRVDLVYSVALRQVGGDAHLAEDVTQRVFADLARKAPQLAQRAVLSGWLYRSAQFAASDVVRSERRRRVREQESHAMHHTATTPTSTAEWEKLRPLLDDALGELPDEDRDAVALRFFEEKPFAEIGRALRLTEDTARKRVERSLDRLAAALSRRGVTSTSTALGLALANQALVAAPVGLATTITGAALAGTAASSGAAVATGSLWFGFVSAKTTIGVAAAIAVLATGGTIHGLLAAKEGRAALASAEIGQVEAHARLRALENQAAAADTRAQAAERDREALLKAIEGARRAGAPVVAAAASGPVTHEMVDARYRRAKDLAAQGKWAEALPELLWCYDDGMMEVESFVGVRSSFLLSEIAKLGKNYPPALDALRARRDQAEQTMMADVGADRATRDYYALNRTLGEETKTLAIYEALARGDPRRALLASGLYQVLANAKRYAEAAEAQPYARMSRMFHTTIQPPGSISPTAEMLQRLRQSAIARAAGNIEVLAGAGQLADARAFASEVLAVDNSSETRALLSSYAARAGHPDLLGSLQP